MHDSAVLAASMASRGAYARVAPHMHDGDFTPTAAFWWKLVGEWYDRDPQAQSVDKSLLAGMGKRRITNPKHEETLLGYLRDLDTGVSVENVVQDALELKRFNKGMELASAIGSQAPAEKQHKLLEEFQALLQATTLQSLKGEWEEAVDWDELDSVVGQAKRIPFSIKMLTERTNGGALPGHSILIYGRPEVGKSLLALEMTAGMLWQKQRVLYIGNEDSIHVLKKRMLVRLSGKTETEIDSSPKLRGLAVETARQKADGRLRMLHLHRGTAADVEHAIHDFEPQVLVLDQIRNLQAHTAEGKTTQRLEQVASDVRYLLARYSLIGISVTQANDRSEGYKQKPPIWLSLADIDSSRTGLPAQMDLIVGVGADENMMQRNQRALSLPKNKLSSAQNAHEGFIVEYDIEHGRVK